MSLVLGRPWVFYYSLDFLPVSFHTSNCLELFSIRVRKRQGSSTEASPSAPSMLVNRSSTSLMSIPGHPSRHAVREKWTSCEIHIMLCWIHFEKHKINGLEQERRNSSALAMELCLSCTNPSKYVFYFLSFPKTEMEDKHLPILTHWGRDKMANIFQMIFSNAFSLMKMYKFWWRFHWCLFLRVQLTIFLHWFR